MSRFAAFVDCCVQEVCDRSAAVHFLECIQAWPELGCIEPVVQNLADAATCFADKSVQHEVDDNLHASLKLACDLRPHISVIARECNIPEPTVGIDGGEYHPLWGECISTHPIYACLVNCTELSQLDEQFKGLQLQVWRASVVASRGRISLQTLKSDKYGGDIHAALAGASRSVRDLSLSRHRTILETLDPTLEPDKFMELVSGLKEGTSGRTKRIVGGLDLLLRHAFGSTKDKGGGGGGTKGKKEAHLGFVRGALISKQQVSDQIDPDDAESEGVEIQLNEFHIVYDIPNPEISEAGLPPEDADTVERILSYQDSTKPRGCTISNAQAARAAVRAMAMAHQMLPNDIRRLTPYELAVADSELRKVVNNPKVDKSLQLAALLGLLMLWMGRTPEQLAGFMVDEFSSSLADLVFDPLKGMFLVKPLQIERARSASTAQEDCCELTAERFVLPDLADLGEPINSAISDQEKTQQRLFTTPVKRLTAELRKLLAKVNEELGTRLTVQRLSAALMFEMSCSGLRDAAVAQLAIGRTIPASATAAYYRRVGEQALVSTYMTVASYWKDLISAEQEAFDHES